MPRGRRLGRALLVLALSLLPAVARAQPDPEEWAPPVEPAPPVAPEPPMTPTLEPGPGPPAPSPPARPRPRFENPYGPRPEPAVRFGLAGQMVLDTGLFFSLSKTTFRVSPNETSQSQIALNPALGAFVQQDLLIRLRLHYSYLSQEDDSQDTFGIGLGAALNVAFSESFSLLPAINVMRLNTETKQEGESPVTYTRLVATFSGHLMYHPAAHVFLGLGPSLSTNLRTRVNGAEGLSVTTVGADGLIGAWW